MKRVYIIRILFMLILAISTVVNLIPSVLAKSDDGGTSGNGATNGAHVNLNIIGVSHEKNENFDGGNGRRIFVLRTGIIQFYLNGDTYYEIVDPDGTDGRVGTGLTGPGIILPYDESTSLTWRARTRYVRLVGPEGSELTWTSYFYNQTYIPCSSFTLEKSSRFSWRTSQLLADGFQDIHWHLDPVTKFRICQIRIYIL